jgi:hypothetical protein
MTNLIVLRAAHPLLIQTQVQGVVLEHSVASANIQHHWEDSPRVKAGCCHIQVQLSCALKQILKALVSQHTVLKEDAFLQAYFETHRS